MISGLLKRLLGRQVSVEKNNLNKKTFERSQAYEFKHSIEFMRSPIFQELIKDLQSGALSSSTGYVNPLVLMEFFGGRLDEWHSFLSWIDGKRCLDIGPNGMSPLAQWDGPSEKIVIEPLLEQIDGWQKNNLGFSAFSGMTCYSLPGEFNIESLHGMIDGVIYCRNMIDHTPNWPFVLSNISSYAAKDCRLMLWTDLDHGGGADDGHYDITTNPLLFKQLITQLGFKIIREYENSARGTINYGCFAIKQ